jgi:hypothetical protein
MAQDKIQHEDTIASAMIAVMAIIAPESGELLADWAAGALAGAGGITGTCSSIGDLPGISWIEYQNLYQDSTPASPSQLSPG